MISRGRREGPASLDPRHSIVRILNVWIGLAATISTESFTLPVKRGTPLAKLLLSKG